MNELWITIQHCEATGSPRHGFVSPVLWSVPRSESLHHWRTLTTSTDRQAPRSPASYRSQSLELFFEKVFLYPKNHLKSTKKNANAYKPPSKAGNKKRLIRWKHEYFCLCLWILCLWQGSWQCQWRPNLDPKAATPAPSCCNRLKKYQNTESSEGSQNKLGRSHVCKGTWKIS